MGVWRLRIGLASTVHTLAILLLRLPDSHAKLYIAGAESSMFISNFYPLLTEWLPGLGLILPFIC